MRLFMRLFSRGCSCGARCHTSRQAPSDELMLDLGRSLTGRGGADSDAADHRSDDGGGRSTQGGGSGGGANNRSGDAGIGGSGGSGGSGGGGGATDDAALLDLRRRGVCTVALHRSNANAIERKLRVEVRNGRQ